MGRRLGRANCRAALLVMYGKLGRWARRRRECPLWDAGEDARGPVPSAAQVGAIGSVPGTTLTKPERVCAAGGLKR